MTAAVIARPDMPGFTPADLDEAHTPSSDFSLPQTMVPNASGMYTFPQTGPADLMNGSPWDTTAEGPQNFNNDFSDAGSAHPGDSEDLIPFAFGHGHMTPRGLGQDQTDAVEDFPNKWAAAAQAVAGGEPMRRGASRSSTSSNHKHRITKGTSSTGRPRLASTLSQTSSKLSALDMTGNASPFRDGSRPVGPMMSPDQLFPDTTTGPVPQHFFYTTLPMDINMLSDGLPSFQAHVDPSQMHLDPDTSLTGNSPTTSSWDSFSAADSRMSSPPAFDDNFSPLHPASSPSDSHHSGSPIMPGQSPRMSRHLGAQQIMPEDLNGSVMTTIGTDDTYALSSSFASRRLSNEGESARDHPLYKNATPKKDGLYHCPWESSNACTHKPEKLKCNYDKFVDSHLKPYRCKVASCESAQFSSTACLLRHEREAHAMHGHGDKPFLCNYEGCDRAVPGNGFPRQWNLKDHMRRVHNDNGIPPQAGTAATSPPPAPGPNLAAKSKGRKRKNDNADSTNSTNSTGRRSSKSEPKGPAKATVVDQYRSYHRSVEELLRGLGRPDDKANIKNIKEAQARLTAMGKITQDLTSSAKSEGANHRSFVPAG